MRDISLAIDAKEILARQDRGQQEAGLRGEQPATACRMADRDYLGMRATGESRPGRASARQNACILAKGEIEPTRG
jgi:hypothetical protein